MVSSHLTIRPLLAADLEAIRSFTDREIGAHYFSIKELEEIYSRSSRAGIMYSLVLVDEAGKIHGVRIAYPPGNWLKGKGHGLRPERWPHALEETGYFQSIFLASSLSGQGWGGRLSREALARLRAIGAKGVVCHSWKESPNNSSFRYLQKLGFSLIAEHSGYWQNVPYDCTRCLKPPCQCTAQEMYLDLEGRIS
jgi:L-amino acid N-acyltransferase YncA